MRYDYCKNTHFIVVFLLSLGVILADGDRSWGKNEGSAKHVTLIYTSNTSGFTEPSG